MTTITLADSPRDTTESLPRARVGFAALLAAIISIRLIVLSFGFMSINLASEEKIDRDFATGTPMVAFDSVYYLQILKHGYWQNDPPREVAFFPLYPLLGRALSPVMAPEAALLVISNVCAIAGLSVFYFWARRITNADVALVSTLVLCCYTGSVFLSSALTEGPFVLLVSTVLLLMSHKRFYWAAAVCAVAATLRPTTIAVTVTLVLAFMIHAGLHTNWFRTLCKAALIGLIGYSGTLVYQTYLWAATGDPQVYMKAQDTWQDEARAWREQQASQHHALKALYETGVLPEPPAERFTWPWVKERLLKPGIWNHGIASALIALSLVGLIASPGGLPRVLYTCPILIALLATIPHEGMRFGSVTRYELGGLVLFVLMGVLLARVRSMPLRYGVLGAMLVTQCYYAWMYSRGVWVG
jgi:hypothetical protein